MDTSDKWNRWLLNGGNMPRIELPDVPEVEDFGQN